MWRFSFSCTITLVFVSAAANAATYTVRPDGSGDYPTIQAAIDAAFDEDFIELSDGTFAGEDNRDIDYLGKAITVRSQSGDPGTCIVDCEGSETDPHRGFYFHSGETGDAVLEGITVTNGYVIGEYPDYHGGGFLIELASTPTIRDCIISNCAANVGGGVFCSQSSPTFTNCQFLSNWAEMGGGGMQCWGHSSPTLFSCTFSNNEAGSQGGGGLDIKYYSDPSVTNCTFYGNSAEDRGAGVHCHQESYPTLVNTIIAFSSLGEAINCEGEFGTAMPTLTCCNLFGNEGGDWGDCIADQYGVDGNISADPMLCDPDNGDFRLDVGSPCAPFSPPNEECDLIGAWPVGCLPFTYTIHPDGSGDYPTIQDAIDAASDGDVIELTDGMFHGAGNRNLDCLGKEITIRSQSGDPWTCTINSGYQGRGFNFHSGEDHSTIVDGITIAYGFGVNDGLGIRCENASPWIRNCRIVDNGAAEDRGGGIYCLECSPRISDCTIARNSSQYGGGIYCQDASPLIERCVISGNYAVQQGGGLGCHWYSNPTIVSCTFYANDVVGSGGAVCCSYSSDPHLAQCILAFSVRGEGFMCVDGGSDPTLICCDIYGNPDGDWVDCIASQLGQAGNISLDPFFCSPEDGNLYLAEDSPCTPFTPPNQGCDQIGAYPVGCAPMDVIPTMTQPRGFALSPPQPNPSRARTRFTYQTPANASGDQTFEVFDAAGRLVKTLSVSPQSDDTSSFLWDGCNQTGSLVPPGVYFAKLTLGRENITRTVVVIR